MTTVAQGQSRIITLRASDAIQVSASGDAYVDHLSGTPESPYASTRLFESTRTKVFGPYGQKAEVRIRAVEGNVTFNSYVNPQNVQVTTNAATGQSVLLDPAGKQFPLNSDVFDSGQVLLDLVAQAPDVLTALARTINADGSVSFKSTGAAGNIGSMQWNRNFPFQAAPIITGPFSIDNAAVVSSMWIEFSTDDTNFTNGYSYQYRIEVTGSSILSLRRNGRHTPQAGLNDWTNIGTPSGWENVKAVRIRQRVASGVVAGNGPTTTWGKLYSNRKAMPLWRFDFDGSNLDQYTIGFQYFSALGIVGNTTITVADIAQANKMTVAQLEDEWNAGWGVNYRPSLTPTQTGSVSAYMEMAETEYKALRNLIGIERAALAVLEWVWAGGQFWGPGNPTNFERGDTRYIKAVYEKYGCNTMRGTDSVGQNIMQNISSMLDMQYMLPAVGGETSQTPTSNTALVDAWKSRRAIAVWYMHAFGGATPPDSASLDIFKKVANVQAAGEGLVLNSQQLSARLNRPLILPA